MDASMAARTLACDVRRGEWSAEILQAAGIAAHKLPPVRPAGEGLGTIPSAVAGRLGLPEGVCVVQGGHDQPVGALGGGVEEPGEALYAVGTTEAVVAVVDGFRDDLPRRGIPCYPHVVPGRWVALAGSQSGGRVLGWYGATMGLAEAGGVEALLALAEDDLPHGPLLLPHFAGTGSVLADEAASAALLGLRFETTRGDVVRALLEGITYEQAIAVEAMEAAGVPLRRLRASGGGARSALWLQMKADILGRPVARAGVADAPCFGAARLAGRGIGIELPLPSADPGACHYPRPAHHLAHGERRRLYLDLYRALRPFAARLRAAPAVSSSRVPPGGRE
jgi:xylulokinase